MFPDLPGRKIDPSPPAPMQADGKAVRSVRSATFHIQQTVPLLPFSTDQHFKNILVKAGQEGRRGAGNSVSQMDI